MMSFPLLRFPRPGTWRAVQERKFPTWFSRLAGQSCLRGSTFSPQDVAYTPTPWASALRARAGADARGREGQLLEVRLEGGVGLQAPGGAGLPRAGLGVGLHVQL